MTAMLPGMLTINKNESSKYYQLHNSDVYNYALPFNAVWSCSCLSVATVVAVILTVVVAAILTAVVESVLPPEQTIVYRWLWFIITQGNSKLYNLPVTAMSLGADIPALSPALILT